MVLSALRGVSLAACISAFGALLFTTLILRARSVPPRLYWLTLVSTLGAIVLTLAWLLMQADAMADADTLADSLAAVPVVAFDTAFGHVILARLALLIATLVLLIARRLVPAVLTSAVAVVLQTGIAHAYARMATDGPVLLMSEILHLLAAGAWLGALVPLAISLPPGPPAARQLLRAFSPLGLACVLVIAGTGLVQAGMLVGRFDQLTGSEYGHLALVKLAIFAVLLVVACLNRFVLLEQPQMLRVSLAVEIALGSLVILTASRLASTEPSAP
jgi:putative copper resistance protein D